MKNNLYSFIVTLINFNKKIFVGTTLFFAFVVSVQAAPGEEEDKLTINLPLRPMGLLLNFSDPETLVVAGSVSREWKALSEKAFHRREITTMTHGGFSTNSLSMCITISGVTYQNSMNSLSREKLENWI